MLKKVQNSNSEFRKELMKLENLVLDKMKENSDNQKKDINIKDSLKSNDIVSKKHIKPLPVEDIKNKSMDVTDSNVSADKIHFLLQQQKVSDYMENTFCNHDHIYLYL